MRVLMVCFEFPPAVGPSVQRIRSVYEGFLSKGYAVDVLTVSDSCYRNLDHSSLQWVDPASLIMRCFAFDAVEKLSVAGKHLSITSVPDRFGLSWGVTFKKKLKAYFASFCPDLVWSSSPLPTCHKIACYVKKNTGCFWVADYRDPSPHRQSKVPFFEHLALEKIDKRVADFADVITFATERIASVYKSLYPISDKSFVMKNGFSESQFKSLNEFKSIAFSNHLSPVLYYAGVLYPDGRDPRALFDAMKSVEGFDLVFQGVGDGSEYLPCLKGIEDRVSFLPSVSNKEALSNMCSADVLLIIQGERFNSQIPSKLYEMLRTGKPILILTPPDSETAKEAMCFEGVFLAESVEEISVALRSALLMKKVVREHIICLERQLQFNAMFDYMQQSRFY